MHFCLLWCICTRMSETLPLYTEEALLKIRGSSWGSTPRFLNIAPNRETRESSLGIRNPGRESDCLIQTLPHHTCWETVGKIVELPMAVSLSLTGDVTNHPTSHSY